MCIEYILDPRVNLENNSVYFYCVRVYYEQCSDLLALKLTSPVPKSELRIEVTIPCAAPKKIRC